MTEIMTEVVLPIFICVILPVSIVWIVQRTIKAKMKLMSDTILTAIEKNPNINVDDVLKGIYMKKTLTPEEKLLDNLRTGLITLIMGIGIIILPFVTGIDKDIIIGGVVLVAVGVGYTATYIVGNKTKKQEQPK